MMFKIEVAMTIRKPRRDIAWVIFNPLCDTAWSHQVLEVRLLAHGPLRAGSCISRVCRFLGRRYHDVVEIVEYVPGQFIEMAMQRPLAIRVRYSLEGIPEGTIVRVHATGRSTGLLRLIGPLTRRTLRRNYIRSLHDLKSLMESNHFRTLPVAGANRRS